MQVGAKCREKRTTPSASSESMAGSPWLGTEPHPRGQRPVRPQGQPPRRPPRPPSPCTAAELVHILRNAEGTVPIPPNRPKRVPSRCCQSMLSASPCRHLSDAPRQGCSLPARLHVGAAEVALTREQQVHQDGAHDVIVRKVGAASLRQQHRFQHRRGAHVQLLVLDLRLLLIAHHLRTSRWS